MSKINQFQPNVAVYNPAAGLSANYVASLNNANANVTIGIGGTVNSGNLMVTANTISMSPTTGAVLVNGGVCLINGNVVVGSGLISTQNGPAITTSYVANSGGILQTSLGDIVYASSDVNPSTNGIPNVSFGATFTITNGIPLVYIGGGTSSGYSTTRLGDGTYKWFGSGNPGNNGAGLYRRVA